MKKKAKERRRAVRKCILAAIDETDGQDAWIWLQLSVTHVRKLHRHRHFRMKCMAEDLIDGLDELPFGSEYY